MEWSAQIDTNPGLLYNPLLEYLLVANPDENLDLRLAEEKQSFFDIYKEKIAVKTKPHITVAGFMAKEGMEETMIRWMQRIISSQTRFTVLLNNYSGFPPHTVYLRVQDHSPFTKLASSLQTIDQYVRGNDCPAMKLVTHPHLTIARGLPQNIYEKAISAYAQKTFCATFEVKELILLRRQHQFDKCKQVSVFHLATDNRTFN